MDFNKFFKDKKNSNKIYKNYSIPGIVTCSKCRNKQDGTHGTICNICGFENDDFKREQNKIIFKKKLQQEKIIRMKKEEQSAKEEIIEIAKIRIQKENEIKNTNWDKEIDEKKRDLERTKQDFMRAYEQKKILLEKEIDEKKRELEIEKDNLKKISNRKIQDLIKIPEVIEKAKMQIHEENRLEKLEEEEKNKSIKAEFIEIVNFIRTDFYVDGKIHDEEALEGQLRQVLRTQFKNKHEFDRQQRIAGGANRLDILINKKFVIELKIPESPSSLRNLYGQLRDYWEEYGDNICVFILKQEGFDSQVIDLWVNRYKNDFGIESIVKDGEKKKPHTEGMNSKLSD